jgi:predicted Rossmann-fold nucleotide-binding protein
MYAAPQTPDGAVVGTPSVGAAERLRVEVSFSTDEAFRALVRGREDEIVFASRSRLARLGIDVAPTGPLAWEGEHLHLEAEVRAVVSSYGVGPLLAQVVLPGLPVGRLVFCPVEERLTAEEIDACVQANAFQLPASYSIDHDGRFRIRPQGHVYGLLEPLTVETLTTIVARSDGKDLLNRIQVRRPVDRIVLPPNDGVITSCSMFLHAHYVVLESEAGGLGRHLEAVVLDPVTTRGSKVFLEFVNTTGQRIVNPAVSAFIYRGQDVPARLRRWWAIGESVTTEAAASAGEPTPEQSYARLKQLFDRLEQPCAPRRYSHRLVAAVDDMDAVLAGATPRWLWCRPPVPVEPGPGADLSARRVEEFYDAQRDVAHGTSILAQLPRGAGATLLLGYFPNLVEHTQICSAALEGRVRRIVFRRASFEHGSFLSSRDHGRLADYEGLGIEVYWCNDERGHVVTHVFRGLRGYFVPPAEVERFRTSLVIAAYGSSRPLEAEQTARAERLIESLNDFFGGEVALLTGGGPGSMQQTTDFAQKRGLMVGASFIETVDQTTNKTADFYQTFQGRSRQARQRWFEIASFHLFFMGGVGTLEEVGLTLTDMKLGVIEVSPLVFFGRHEGGPYWQRMKDQFAVMVAAGRAPAWLLTHAHVTDDPDEVPRLYKRILELG